MGFWGDVKDFGKSFLGTMDDPATQNRKIAEEKYGSKAGSYGDMRGNAVFDQYGNMLQTPADQQRLLQMLEAESRGQGIGQQLARKQAQDQADAIFRQQLAASAAARPGHQGMAAYNAASNAANAQSAVGGQAAQAGGQLALQAQGQLQNMYGQLDRRQMELLNQRLQMMNQYEAGRTGRYSSLLSQKAGNTGGNKLLGGLLGGGAGVLGQWAGNAIGGELGDAVGKAVGGSVGGAFSGNSTKEA